MVIPQRMGWPFKIKEQYEFCVRTDVKYSKPIFSLFSSWHLHRLKMDARQLCDASSKILCWAKEHPPEHTGVAFHAIYYLKSGNFPSHAAPFSTPRLKAKLAQWRFRKKVTAPTLSYTKAIGPCPPCFATALCLLVDWAQKAARVSQEKKFEWIFNEMVHTYFL